MSILSFPERGKWGKSSWAGNCSGYIYEALFNQYKPATFCDPMMGSGTSIEVAREMGIEAFGLDLHQGFNAVTDSILATIGKEVDFCHSHPPYGSMHRYSGNVWGDAPHSGDLSHCLDDSDFHEKLHLVLMNQREATKAGGIYGTLIGDMRCGGRYVSYQAECIARMPADELVSVMIKAQHNTRSSNVSYSKMRHAFITHEYILLWQKPSMPFSILLDLSSMANQANRRLQSAWRVVVTHAMRSLGGKADLSDLYNQIAKESPEKLKSNNNWKAKVRQILQESAGFKSLERGVWALG